jgi:hypothetical protein
MQYYGDGVCTTRRRVDTSYHIQTINIINAVTLCQYNTHISGIHAHGRDWIQCSVSPILYVSITDLLISVTSHERWFVARRSSGYPFVITALVSYPTSALPTEDHIRSRVDQLRTCFEALRCVVRDNRTRTPYWEEGITSGLVNTVSCDFEPQEDCLVREQKRMEQEDFDGGRSLWQVTTYASQRRAYVAISALHELIDGRGLLRLVRALLAQDPPDLPYEKLSSVATYPDSIDIRPSWQMLLQLAVSETVYPWLPQYITSYFAAPPVWPIGLLTINPLELPGSTTIINLSLDLTTLLKSLGRYHGVPTLTPTLFTAWLVAMQSVLGVNTLSGSIAVDERSEDLRHSYCSGLYHASHLYSVRLMGVTSFWSTARGVALHIADRSSLRTARMRMGMTAWVPDGSVPNSRRDDLRRPTAWEDWQLQRNASLNPYVSSISFSNLGKVDLPLGADDLVVASSPSIGDPPIKLVLTGTPISLNVAVTCRVGDILESEQAGEIGRRWIKYLRQLVSGKGQDLLLGSFDNGDTSALNPLL